jgi:probable HAF family extracellular repeat protein
MKGLFGRHLAVSAIVIVAPALVVHGEGTEKAGLIESGLPAAPAFIPLGQLPGSTSGSQAARISPDGQVVIGTAISPQGTQAFRWTINEGMVGLGDLPGGAFVSVATGLSINGTVIVGWSASANGEREAFRWKKGIGMNGLGDLPGGEFNSTASAVSANGATVVGWSTTDTGVEAFRWSLFGGLHSLGDLAGGIVNSHAQGISGNGSTIVGWGNSGVSEAFTWSAATGMVGLGFAPDALLDGSQAFDVSFDGQTIVGYAWAPLGVQAMRYTATDGMRVLGDLPGGNAQPFSFAFGVSADGRIIVGRGDTDDGTRAFIWDASHGMRDLQQVLEVDFGLKDMAGWTLIEARGVDIFGQTIVGWGRHNGIEEAWLVRLPDPCPADLNHDGIVGMQDLLLMLNLTGPCQDCMNCAGDLNGDCQVDSADFLALFAEWGDCP